MLTTNLVSHLLSRNDFIAYQQTLWHVGRIGIGTHVFPPPINQSESLSFDVTHVTGPKTLAISPFQPQLALSDSLCPSFQIPVLLPTPVITGMSTQKRKVHSACSVNASNLTLISCHPQSVSGPIEKELKLALLNVRSLADKSFFINNLITSCNLDFMLLTETCLDSISGAAALSESAPPHFTFVDVARPDRKGDGLALLCRVAFQCKQLSFGNFTSFEYIKCSSHILLLVIYRPLKYSSSFIGDFAELLSTISTKFSHPYIHINNPNDSTSREFSALLVILPVSPSILYVRAYHNRGHTLDLIICHFKCNYYRCCLIWSLLYFLWYVPREEHMS